MKWLYTFKIQVATIWLCQVVTVDELRNVNMARPTTTALGNGSNWQHQYCCHGSVGHNEEAKFVARVNLRDMIALWVSIVMVIWNDRMWAFSLRMLLIAYYNPASSFNYALHFAYHSLESFQSACQRTSMTGKRDSHNTTQRLSGHASPILCIGSDKQSMVFKADDSPTSWYLTPEQ